ncbi:hypothetical protein EOL94_01190 [bacterium]|nr:hypothetical protein [bacterium]
MKLKEVIEKGELGWKLQLVFVLVDESNNILLDKKTDKKLVFQNQKLSLKAKNEFKIKTFQKEVIACVNEKLKKVFLFSEPLDPFIESDENILILRFEDFFI